VKACTDYGSKASSILTSVLDEVNGKFHGRGNSLRCVLHMGLAGLDVVAKRKISPSVENGVPL
jgi:hypothetical protein